jgi:hypothetical protein
MAGTKHVFLSVNAAQRDLSTARLALKDRNSWIILGDDWQLYGVNSFAAMPAVSCQVVDLCSDTKALQMAMSAYLVHRNIETLKAAVLSSCYKFTG